MAEHDITETARVNQRAREVAQSLRHVTVSRSTVNDGEAQDWRRVTVDRAEIAALTAERWMQEGRSRNSVRMDDGDGWRGTKTAEDYRTILVKGWPEGAARARRILDQITAGPLPSAATRAPRLAYDVAGAYPVPALAAAGEPACMVTWGEDMLHARPILRLVADLSYSAFVDAKDIETHGLLVAAVIDQLESQDIRCEVTSNFYVQSSSGRFYHCFWTAKEANEPLDLASLVAQIAHPSALRRAAFAMLETIQGDEQLFHNYGRPQPPRAFDNGPGAIILPTMQEIKEDTKDGPRVITHKRDAMLKRLRSIIAGNGDPQISRLADIV